MRYIGGVGSFLALLLLQALTLSAPLEQWKKEIEAKSQGKVVALRIFAEDGGRYLRLPEDPAYHDILKQFFFSANFVPQFLQSHAMSINHRSADGANTHFVLMNEATRGQWNGEEEAVEAHEFGHIWLRALGYPSPVYQGGQTACLAVSTGDIIQHIVIRGEIQKRKIRYLPYWTQNLEGALAVLKDQEGKPQPPVPLCQKLSQLALWMDVELGLTSNQWPKRDEFLATMLKRFPELEAPAKELKSNLAGLNVVDKTVHRKALIDTFSTLKRLGILLQ